MSSEACRDPVIVVEGLGKQYVVQRGRGDASVKGSVLSWLRRERLSRSMFWALRDVDFTVQRGETLGIVGANGAGKSTLLSLLAKTKYPTEGTLEIQGVVSSMLELGAGFHPDLTGRENVFLAGALMGLSRKRMRQRFDAIVEFAELQDFIDQPVKHYSSGMYVRLGFSVATEVDPDILLLDEVLAVGDASFQRKCLDRIATFRKERKTMLMISHDLGTIMKISDRILFLEQGQVRGLGDPENVADQYDSHSRRETVSRAGREWGTGEVTLTQVRLENASDEEQDTFSFGEKMTIRISYRADHRVESPVFGFALSGASGEVLYGNNTQLEGFVMEHIEGEGSLKLVLERINLGPGQYTVSVAVHSGDHQVNFHRLDGCFPFTVVGKKAFEGCFIPVRWSVES